MKQEPIVIGAIIFSAVIFLGVALLILKTLPVRNEIQDNCIIVHFALGNSLSIDTSGAEFSPVPDNAREHIIRTNGTSIGKIHSGHFKNVRTGDRFLFYITGKGEKVYFESNGKNYVVDITENN